MKLFLLFLPSLQVLGSLTSPGRYTQWREKLAFAPGDSVPDCKEACYQKCGPEHKGVSICNSVLEYLDPEPEPLPQGYNGTSTTPVIQL